MTARATFLCIGATTLLFVRCGSGEHEGADSPVATIQKVDRGSVVIDGDGEDWSHIDILMVDGRDDVMNHEYDLESLKAVHDGEHLYALIQFVEGVSQKLQREVGRVTIGDLYIDADDDKNTGSHSSYIGTSDVGAGLDFQLTLQCDFQIKGGTKVPVVKMALKRYDVEKSVFLPVPGSSHSSLDKDRFVAAKGSHIEVRLPMKQVGAREGSIMRCVFGEIGLKLEWDDALTQARGRLGT